MKDEKDQDKKVSIQANEEVVKDFCEYMCAYIYSKEMRTVDVLTSFVGMIIKVGLTQGVSKASVLNYLSNNWEMNDK